MNFSEAYDKLYPREKPTEDGTDETMVENPEGKNDDPNDEGEQ